MTKKERWLLIGYILMDAYSHETTKIQPGKSSFICTYNLNVDGFAGGLLYMSKYTK